MTNSSKFYLAILATLAIWQGLTPQTATAASTTPTPISANFFGAEVNNIVPHPGNSPAPNLALPFQTLRLSDAPAFTGILNPRPNIGPSPNPSPYDWTNLDTAIAYGKTNKVDMMYTFVGTPYPIPSGVIQYRDLAGNLTEIASGSGDVPITNEPILFENMAAQENTMSGSSVGEATAISLSVEPF